MSWVPGVVLSILVVSNIALAAGVIFAPFAQPAEGSEPVQPILSTDDHAHVSLMNGEFVKNTFAGEVQVENDQHVPLKGVVVTVQLAINNKTSQISQFTTDAQGNARFSFSLEEPVPLWVEVLDVNGQGVVYDADANKASRVVVSRIDLDL